MSSAQSYFFDRQGVRGTANDHGNDINHDPPGTVRPIRPARSYYKPTGLHTAWFVFLAAAIAAVLGALEHVHHVLPDQGFFGGREDGSIPTLYESSAPLTTEDSFGYETETDVVYVATETYTLNPPTTTPLPPDFNPSITTELATFQAELFSGEMTDVDGSIIGTITTTEPLVGAPAPESFLGGGSGVTAAVTTFTEPTATTTAPVFFLAAPTRTAAPEAADAVTNGESMRPNKFFESDQPLIPVWEPGLYLAAIYVPIIIAVVLRLLVGSTYTVLRKMEPFYLLSRRGGASAKEVWDLDYLCQNGLLDPLHALRSGRWLVLVASLAYATAQLVTPFASELLVIADSEHRDGVIVTRATALWLNLAVCRAIEGLLGLMLLFLICTWILLQFRPAKLHSDPSGIAGIASILNHRETMEIIQQLELWKRDKTTAEQLEILHLRLGAYYNAEGVLRNGLTLREPNIARNPYGGHAPRNIETDYDYRPSRLSRHVQSTVFVFVLSSLLVLIAYYFKTSGDSPFEDFMDSEAFGPRFMMTIVGMVIKFQWMRLARIRAVNDPFWTLLREPSPSRTAHAFVQRRHSDPFSLFFLSLYYQARTTALVASMAILSEILIILLAGVPFNPTHTYATYLADSLFSIAILGVMVVVAVGLWIAEPPRPWPLEPSSLGAMVDYLTWSALCQDMADTSLLGTAERDRMVNSWGQSYRFSRDGSAWTVDYQHASPAVIQVPVGRTK